MGPEKRNSRLPDPVSRKRKKRGGDLFFAKVTHGLEAKGRKRKRKGWD